MKVFIKSVPRHRTSDPTDAGYTLNITLRYSMRKGMC